MEKENLDNSIEEVIRYYSSMVYRLAFARTRTKHDADDIFQEVFLRYVKKEPRFESENHRRAWLIKVTINCSNSLWRSLWRRGVEELTDNLVFESKETLDLHNELQKLPKKYREVIHLFYYENMSTEEIGRVLGRKNSTVRTQLTRGRALLKGYIEEADYV